MAEFTNILRRFRDMPGFASSPLNIVVTLDNDNQNFILPREIATKYSAHLRNAVRDNPQLGTTGNTPIEIRGHSPRVFNVFHAFLHTGRIYSAEWDTPAELWNAVKATEQLADLWVLGVSLKSEMFKDAVVDAIIDMLRADPEDDSIPYKKVYGASSVTLRQAGMKRLLVEMAVFSWDESTMKEATRDDDPSKFFQDMTESLWNLRNVRLPAAPFLHGPTCRYHDHGEGGRCYKVEFA